jgi:endonuclease-8
VPEGHTVHRIARQLDRDFVGHRLTVTSPQGRFAAGASRLDGRVLVGSRAVGKQLFLTVEGGEVLRVHLGL